MRERRYYVYILSNRRRTVLYIGMTNNLARRMTEHKGGLVDGFSKRYRVRDLLWFETFSDVNEAIVREKRLKNWHRDWKWNLVRQHNPSLEDMSVGLARL